jgi:DNA-binding NtrC family response regulator
LTLGFLNALAAHSWPGNVRELQNVVERSLVLADGGEHLGVKDLPLEFQGLAVPVDAMAGTFHQLVRSFKRELVRSALRAQDGNRLHAARELGISRCYLHRLLNQLNINEVVAGPMNEGEEEFGETPAPEVPASRGGFRELRIVRVA